MADIEVDLDTNGAIDIAFGGTNATTVAGARASLSVSERVDVKNFGAVGDGVVFDTVAIQSAIDAVGSGGEVFIPSGT